MDYSNDFSQNAGQNNFAPTNFGPSVPQQQGFSSPFPQNPPGFNPVSHNLSGVNTVPQNSFGFNSAPPQGGSGFGMSNQPNNFSMNQQFLLAAGQQLLSNPVAAAAIDAYSQ